MPVDDRSSLVGGKWRAREYGEGRRLARGAGWRGKGAGWRGLGREGAGWRTRTVPGGSGREPIESERAD